MTTAKQPQVLSTAAAVERIKHIYAEEYAKLMVSYALDDTLTKAGVCRAIAATVITIHPRHR